MVVEIRGSGTRLTTGDVRLSVNIQGDHRYDPPEGDLKRMVESWLKDMNLPIIEEERNFELQTREFKMKTLQRGVRVVRMAQFARNALELRVCTESHFGYLCYLICPSARVAV
jgi:hypothetical protein